MNTIVTFGFWQHNFITKSISQKVFTRKAAIRHEIFFSFHFVGKKTVHILTKQEGISVECQPPAR